MNIPQSFEILGKVYKVKMIDATGMDFTGYYNPQTLEIQISKGQPRELFEHVFFHELIHCILQNMGERELYENEKFTDLFGGILHQVMATMKGKLA